MLWTAAVKGENGGNRPDVTAPWKTVSLPDDWTERWPDYSGTVWYRIDWKRHCEDAAAPPLQVALAIEYLVMAGEVFINDDRLWSDARLTEPLSRSWNMPRYWLLPASVLRPGINTVWVRVVGVAQQQSGMGSIRLGAPSQVLQWHDSLWWRNRVMFTVNLIVSCVMGVVFFCIWLSRRDQTVDGWYALMAFFWVLFVSNILVTNPWPFPTTLISLRANAMFFVLYIATLCVFTWRFGDQSLPRTEKALWVVSGLLILLMVFAPDDRLLEANLLLTFVVMTVYIANSVQFAVHAWRTRQLDHVILAIGFLTFVSTGILDLMALFKVNTGLPPLTPFTSVVWMLCMSAVLALRQRRNVRRIEGFNEELTARIERARSELGATMEREHVLALSNTRMQERLQVAHDLHDGLGGSLVRMMAMVEQAKAPLQNRQVMSFLKLIRDDLRQSIDSGSSTGIKVPDTPQEWLAPLRHRFVQLFDELGIHSDWKFPGQWRTPPDALQCLALTRMVEESLVNVVKHSRAKRVQLRLRQPTFDTLQLFVEDDGVGFDVDMVQHAGISVGMRSMQARAARVGGTLEVVSQPGLTRLTIQLQLGPQPG